MNSETRYLSLSEATERAAVLRQSFEQVLAMFRSPFQRAIDRGLKSGGNLVDELDQLRDYTISTRKDALAICRALDSLPALSPAPESIRSPLHALTALFQKVEGPKAAAFGVLYEQGLPLLIHHFDVYLKKSADDYADDLLFILKILAIYGSHDGVERIVKAAHLPLKPDAYLWSPILSMFADGHPEQAFVFQQLRDPLPPGFIAVALLDAANSAAKAGQISDHPFNSDAGDDRLRQWLTDTDPERFSYAHSATAALPFIDQAHRGALLALAMDHADVDVQMAAAYSAASRGAQGAVQLLARLCRDAKYAISAKAYLSALGRDDAVPSEAEEPDFLAKAEFARWLAHPCELGRYPDELRIVDQRQLPWPPEQALTSVWLIEYRARNETKGVDDIGRGLVGTVTFCLFSCDIHLRPPEDGYAIHCAWELEHKKLIKSAHVDSPEEYRTLLRQWTGRQPDTAEVRRVADISPQLDYPQHLVGLARASFDGCEGWLALDGSRSTWYPDSDLPDVGFPVSATLQMHIGRNLLGFTDQPDRKAYLENSSAD